MASLPTLILVPCAIAATLIVALYVACWLAGRHEGAPDVADRAGPPDKLGALALRLTLAEVEIEALRAELARFSAAAGGATPLPPSDLELDGFGSFGDGVPPRRPPLRVVPGGKDTRPTP